MNKIYDIAVIGAGPAGAVFAREIARICPELSVLLIDGQTEERRKPCGGLLAPDAQKTLAEFDLTLPNHILADPQIFTVETIDVVAGCTKYYQRHYLNMDRYRFDKWLVSLVPKTVEVISARVTDIARRGSGFNLKLGDADVGARFVVGADGANSPVRRKLCGKMPKQYISVQEWYRETGGGVPFYSCIFDKKTTDSCSWTIHKDGYVIFGGAFRKKGCRDAFAEQKSRLEAHTGISLGEPVKREACLVNSPRRFSDLVCGGEGFFLIGEAAGFISASSYEGISSAMISARALAEAFGKAAEGKDVLGAYRRKTLGLRLKLCVKMMKRAVLCSPALRYLIMKSGICSVKVK